MAGPGISPKPFIILRDADAVDAGELKGAVVAIGNFDGVHRGHRAVIAAALALGREVGRPAAAFTFEPHPRAVIRPDLPLFRLTDESAKLRLLAASGLRGAIVMRFDKALAALSAREFIARFLVGRYAVSGAAIGFDFHFGKGREGSPAFLAEEGARLGFAVTIVPPLQDEGRPVSSGAVRTALEEGRVVGAAELLDYPWFVSGEVIHGEKQGRALGYPTANLRLDPGCALKHGIYAVRVRVAGRCYDGVASFGRRPMFDNGEPLLETFLFDFAGDLYGQRIDVAFIGWIRPELRFDGLPALVAQIDDDCRVAREILTRTPGAFPRLGDIAP